MVEGRGVGVSTHAAGLVMRRAAFIPHQLWVTPFAEGERPPAAAVRGLPGPPVLKAGFTLRPFGFFDRNPVLDVPPPARHYAGLAPVKAAARPAPVGF